MNSPLQNVGHHDHAKIIYWSVIEMIHFDSGEIYGRVRFVGTESECDQWTTEVCKQKFFQLEFPPCFEGRKIVSVALNCIATNHPCTIYKVSSSNIIGRS